MSDHPFYIFNRKELILVLALFILGIIIGSTLLNLYVSKKIDTLILDNKDLQNKIKEQSKQIDQLEKNITKYKQYNQYFIKGLKIQLETDLNKHAQQIIKKTVFELLSDQIGREFFSIDHLLLANNIDDRYIELEDKKVLLQLIGMWPNRDKLNVYIKVTNE